MQIDTVPTDPHPTGNTGFKPQRMARGAMAAGLFLLGLYTLQRFLPSLVWAAIFAVALWPLYRRVRTGPIGRHHGTLTPLLFTLAVALIFIVPIVLIGVQLANEAHNVVDWLQQIQKDGLPMPDFLHRLPYGQQALSEWWQTNLATPGAPREFLGRLTQGRGNMGRNAGAELVRRLTIFAFTLVTLFFLFREGRTVVEQLRKASLRAFGPDGERVGRQIVASIHGTVTGLVLVGLGEGLLLGIVYAFAGVPHPTIFGALTAIAAMVPFAAPVIFALAAVMVMAQGAIVTGVVILVVGFAVTFTADHFIRPSLIGGATELPFLWVLLGILGGVEEWGLLGLFVGPAIMSALIMMWRDYVRACG